MRKRGKLALIALFVVLYGLAMVLPGIVVNTPDSLHENPSVEEARVFLERGAECWTGTGIHLHLDRDHALANEHGEKFSSLGPQQIACHGPDTKTTHYGYMVLIEGWAGALIGIFAWYANVLALVAFMLALTGFAPKTAAWLAGGGFLLGLDAFRFDHIPAFSYGYGLPTTVDHLAPGYYVWEVSMFLLLVSQIVAIRERRASAASRCPTFGTMEH